MNGNVAVWLSLLGNEETKFRKGSYIKFVAACLISILVALNSLGSNKIGVRTIAFYDPTRERPLITEIFYPIAPDAEVIVPEEEFLRAPQARNASPSSSGKMPLVLFSHGDGGTRLDSAWLMEGLAENGYIVASVDHYGNTDCLNLPDVALRRWERPKDASFVLRQLLKYPEIGPLIDKNKIAFAGFSLGGTTGIWLAGGVANRFQKPSIFNSPATELCYGYCDQRMIDDIDYTKAKESYFDPMIKAFFLLAPGYGQAFDQKGLSVIKSPVFIVSGASDERLPIKDNAEFFAKYIAGCKLKVFPGKTGHFVFVGVPTKKGRKSLPQFLIKDSPSVNRSKVHADTLELALAFFKRTLKY